MPLYCISLPSSPSQEVERIFALGKMLHSALFAKPCEFLKACRNAMATCLSIFYNGFTPGQY
ncbi:hypothetical protein DAPPUDRAFT_236459 [Daphnia pulex]|uniref:Uncharacterized protein n=1 Tax=Daphnia pulex TaxID=6669 RepID=E9G125_DAPPU|nr:hypothetical protein DAPPUDRAFT_236459 [Daphnia pulex]|eukprot:EFX86709.1 hypothetical protein DAPPUDRAFT_236459 [Daphnia pulex]